MEFYDTDFEEAEEESGTEGVAVPASLHYLPVGWKREGIRHEGWTVVADPLWAVRLRAIAKCVDVMSRSTRDFASYVVSTNYDEIIELAEQLRRGAQPEVLSPRTAELEKAIDESVWILRLQAGWDGPGAQSISGTTWEKAVELIRKLGQSAINQFAEVLLAPQIGPVADGSIDIFWNGASENLLINVPADPETHATFDGVRPDGSSITGSIAGSEDLAHLTAWLIRR
jgi:hypothetical protein